MEEILESCAFARKCAQQVQIAFQIICYSGSSSLLAMCAYLILAVLKTFLRHRCRYEICEVLNFSSRPMCISNLCSIHIHLCSVRLYRIAGVLELIVVSDAHIEFMLYRILFLFWRLVVLK